VHDDASCCLDGHDRQSLEGFEAAGKINRNRSEDPPGEHLAEHVFKRVGSHAQTAKSFSGGRALALGLHSPQVVSRPLLGFEFVDQVVVRLA
jgi:hypothetical protein